MIDPLWILLLPIGVIGWVGVFCVIVDMKRGWQNKRAQERWKASSGRPITAGAGRAISRAK